MLPFGHMLSDAYLAAELPLRASNGVAVWISKRRSPEAVMRFGHDGLIPTRPGYSGISRVATVTGGGLRVLEGPARLLLAG